MISQTASKTYLQSRTNSRRESVSSDQVQEISQEFQGRDLVPGELLVKLDGEVGTLAMSDFASEYGAKVMEKFQRAERALVSTGGDLFRLKLNQGEQPFEAMAAMRNDERVVFAEPNEIITLEKFQSESSSGGLRSEHSERAENQEPNDLDPKLWGLNNDGQTGGKVGADVSAIEAWQISTGKGSADGPLIAVIDTGIDYNHPDLKANMWTNPGEIPGNGVDDDGNGVVDDIHGYYPAENSGDPMDGNSHGTHCAGTIAGVGNNDQGVTGVMQQARLMAVKIFNDAGSTTTADIVKGINYTSQMGADITSNSWGGGGRSFAIKDAFRSNDALHIVAAGNSDFDNDKRDYFPANYELENIIAVAATNHKDEKASFSQWGATKVDVAAPGRDIWSTMPGGEYGSLSGTSMATPHVSGGAGLILSTYPEASNAEIKERLIHGSDKVDALSDVSVSRGRVNFAESLENDRLAPGAPNDFETTDAKTRGVNLSWTSVGDDQWANGAAQNVELFVSDRPIDESNLSSALKVGLAGGGEVGELMTHHHEVFPSASDLSLHFGLKSVDNAGNRSELRTTSAVLPASQVELSDNFDQQEVKFQPTGDFTRVEVEGRGRVFTTGAEVNTSRESTLTSGLVDLTGKSDAFLKFDAKTKLLWDERAKVQVSTDKGESWNTLMDLEQRKDWSEHGLDLSAYDDQTISLRFQFKIPKRRRSRGLSVDNVVILSSPQPTP